MAAAGGRTNRKNRSESTQDEFAGGSRGAAGGSAAGAGGCEEEASGAGTSIILAGYFGTYEPAIDMEWIKSTWQSAAAHWRAALPVIHFLTVNCPKTPETTW